MLKTLFLPGAGGSASFWQAVSTQLTTHAELLAWPGLGDEPADPSVSSINDLVSIVQGRMDGTVNIVAQSMGGLVAIKAALLSPSRINRLVLVAASAGVPVGDLGAVDWRPEYRQTYPDAAEWIEVSTPDLSEQLVTLTIPTLLIWGDADPISPVSVGRRIHTLLPESTLCVVKGGNHDLAQSHTDEIVPLISEHLSSRVKSS